MHEKIRAARRRVKVKNERLGQGEMGGYYVKIIDSDFGVLREYLEEMELAYEEVHLKKGGSIDAQFIRTVLQGKICNAIKILSDELIGGNIRQMAKSTRFAHLMPVLRHLNSETNNLEIEFKNRYEVEIHELALEAEHDQEKPPVTKEEIIEPGAHSWQEIEIRFTSDERLQIVVAGKSERPSFNYEDFGLSDRRNGMPNKAWNTLRSLAVNRGILKQPIAGQTWAAVEKHIQELRAHLRTHFSLKGDPLPFESGKGYRAEFKIRCLPSFET
jgi:hypothetical protein